MRAFLQISSGEAPGPPILVEHIAEDRVASSVEQRADTFSSIAAVHRWLTAQGAACKTPDFKKLREAVAVLSKTRNPRQDEVCPLCSSWNVPQYERIQHGQNRRRPLAILITELRQAVITEASRVRRIFHGQTAASASSAQLPATLASAASSVECSASSAEQPAAFAGSASSTEPRDVIGCTGKRFVDIVNYAGVPQPGSQQAGAAASSSSTFSGRRFSLTTLKCASLSVGSSLHAPISAVHMQHFLSLHPLQQRRGCISTALHCPRCLTRRLSLSYNRRNRMRYCNIVDVDAPRLHTLPRSKRDPVCSQPNESAELFDIIYVRVSACVNVCVGLSLTLSAPISECASICV